MLLIHISITITCKCTFKLIIINMLALTDDITNFLTVFIINGIMINLFNVLNNI